MHVKHRIDDMDKRFVAGEESMSAGEKVAFMPALEGVLREHLKNSAVRRYLAAIEVFGEIVGQPQLLAHFVDCIELVRCVLVGSEDAKAIRILPHYIPKKSTERPGVLNRSLPGLF